MASVARAAPSGGPMVAPAAHASPPPAAASPGPGADTIGNSFVAQYYTVLHTSPNFLHRFYNDASSLTIAGVGHAVPETVRTQRGINDKVMRLGYDRQKAEIASVDSQLTLGGGVVVQVAGALRAEDGRGAPRHFFQSFVLAPQENGYYVLNDIIRFVDAPTNPPSPGSAEPTPAEPAPVDAAPAPVSLEAVEARRAARRRGGGGGEGER